MKYFDCWLRPIDKKEYARIQQRKESYEKGLGRVFVFLDVDGVLNINRTDDKFTYITSSTVWKIRNEIQLKDLKVGTKVKDTEQTKIEATYLRTDWIFENKERKDRLWIDIKEQEVVGIYYDYKYTD
jgi:hypothetical protein